MSLTDLAGATFGPVSMSISRTKVAEYVAATGDDAARWRDHAPPSFAGSLLFVMAPRFLFSDEVVGYTRVLVHSDQRFRWHRTLDVGSELAVSAAVEKVRARGQMHFVTFVAQVAGASGLVLDSESTFLMSDEDADDAGADAGEPDVRAAAANDVVRPITLPDPGVALPSLAKSASRADLVRYAAASGDFNPVHFDHDTARTAGFPGVVVHGLLMGAWAMQLAAAGSIRPDPLEEARFRFRNPLLPAQPAQVSGSVEQRSEGTVRVAVSVMSRDTDLVTGRATVREA